jgi:apolipoprotein N-acyltransferase
MEFESKAGRWVTAVAAFIATAVLVWFGNGLTPWWPLMWLAPLPLFWFALRSPWWAAAAVACFAWVAGSANLVGYFSLVGMPPAVWFANFGAMGCMVATGVLLFRFLVLRGAVWTGIIALPALWVSVDWLRYWVTPHGTAADLAYTQLNFLPLLQLACLTGPWGMSFVLLLVPAALAAAFELRATRIAVVTGAVMLAVLGFGIFRLNQPRPPTVRVGLLASDRPAGEEMPEPGEKTRQLWSEYAAHARALAAQGARVIVMPEKIAVTQDADTSILQPLADETGATIVAGELRVSGLLRYNRAEVYTPHSPVASYDKEHLLPPFESSQIPGKEKLTLARNATRWGVAICKDMDFTSLSVEYARLGAGLMLIPAWDFNQDRTWHGDMAIMRGVEGGFSVARAAKNGYLMVSDSRGRVIARRRSDSAAFATLLADVPVGHETTLFQRWRDWFAWIAVSLLAWVIARTVVCAATWPRPVTQ